MAGQTPTMSHPRIRSYARLIAIVGFLLLVGSVIAYVLKRDWALATQLGTGIGGILLLGAVLLRPDVVRTALTGRSIKYGSNAVVMSLAFIGILAFVNVCSSKNNQEFDLTETGLFTLSEQTIKVLEGLDRPVQVFGFYPVADSRLNLARNLLERYSLYTDQLTFEFHDPNVEPGLARSFEFRGYGLVFVSDGKHYEVSSVDEQTITSGLIRIARDDQQVVYFITGHGEHSIDDSGPEGYSKLKQALEHESYLANSIDLSVIADVLPSDATALILAGADREMSDTEVILVSEWMTLGGKLMILADPMEPAPLEPLLQEYGLYLGNDIVIEDYSHALVTLGPQGLTPHVIAPVVSRYPYHEITRSLKGYRSFFPYARSITVSSTGANARNVWSIVSTSEGSWAETDMHSTDYEYTKGVDHPGPINIAVAAEDDEIGSRLVVFGNAGFVTNHNVSPEMANTDLFINAVDWLSEEEELISIRPKRPENRQLFLTPLQINFMLFTTVILIPLTVLAVGLGIWWKRR